MGYTCVSYHVYMNLYAAYKSILFRLIWHQTEFRLVPNISEKLYFNLILIQINKNQKRSFWKYVYIVYMIIYIYINYIFIQYNVSAMHCTYMTPLKVFVYSKTAPMTSQMFSFLLLLSSCFFFRISQIQCQIDEKI